MATSDSAAAAYGGHIEHRWWLCDAAGHNWARAGRWPHYTVQSRCASSILSYLLPLSGVFRAALVSCGLARASFFGCVYILLGLTAFSYYPSLLFPLTRPWGKVQPLVQAVCVVIALLASLAACILQTLFYSHVIDSTSAWAHLRISVLGSVDAGPGSGISGSRRCGTAYQQCVSGNARCGAVSHWQWARSASPTTSITGAHPPSTGGCDPTVRWYSYVHTIHHWCRVWRCVPRSSGGLVVSAAIWIVPLARRSHSTMLLLRFRRYSCVSTPYIWPSSTSYSCYRPSLYLLGWDSLCGRWYVLANFACPRSLACWLSATRPIAIHPLPSVPVPAVCDLLVAG